MKNHRSHFTVENDNEKILSYHYNLSKAKEARKKILREYNSPLWISYYWYDKIVEVWNAEDINGT